LSTIKPEYAHTNQFKIKGELNTNHLVKVQLTGTDLVGINGSQVDVSLANLNDSSKQKSTDFEGKGILKQDRFALSLGGIYEIEKKSPKFKGQVVIHYPDHCYWSTVGELSQFVEGDKTLSDLTLDGKFSYIQQNYEGLFNILYKKKEKTTSFTGSWYHETGDHNYGVIGNYKQDGNASFLEASLNIAAEAKCSDGLAIKGRVSTTQKPKDQPTIRTGVSLSQKVSSGFTFTVGADLNVRNMLPGLDENTDLPHSFGFEVKLTDQ